MDDFKFVQYARMLTMLLVAGLIMMFGADNVIDKEFISQHPLISGCAVIPLMFYRPKTKKKE